MKYDEFVAQVQRRADLKTKDEAVQAIQATLETLGERLTGGEAKDLAAQLPPEIATYLQQPLAGSGVPFTLDDFFMRVAEREGCELAEATFNARVILWTRSRSRHYGRDREHPCAASSRISPAFRGGK